MIDQKRLRDDLDALTAALVRKGVPADLVHQAAELDAGWRKAQTEADELRHHQKEASKAIGRAPAD